MARREPRLPPLFGKPVFCISIVESKLAEKFLTALALVAG